MVVSRADAKATTRRRLLDAAASVFAARGFGGATVRQIADAAGYTTGALFAHFPTKDALFLALLEQRYQQKVVAIEEALAAGGLPQLDQRFAALQRDDREAALLATEFWLYAVRHPPVTRALAELQRQFRDGVSELLTTRVPGLTNVDAGRIAAVIIALGDGLGMQAKLDPDALDATLFTDSIQAVIDSLPRRLSGLGRERA